MSDLFQVEGKAFIEALDKTKVKSSNSIDLSDVFDVYVELAVQSTNAVDKDTLRSLVFNQFKKYGDFDNKVRETAQTVTDIKESTGKVITAIEQENTQNIQEEYDKLKTYSGRIQNLENGFLMDEHSTLFNRQYLFTKNLSEELKFQNDGILFFLYIEDIYDIKEHYGSIIVKSIIKKFAQSAKSALAKSKTLLIHYDNNAFVILADEKSSHDIRSALTLLHRSFEIKKFKVGNKTLSFNFGYKESAFTKNQLFEGIYNKLRKEH